MILHFVTNEQFTDYAIQQFSSPEMESEFVLIPSNHEKWTVKLIDQCKIIDKESPEFDELLDRLDQYTAIVLHGMFWPIWQNRLFARLPKSVKVAWVFWGGDIYARHEIGSRFMAPITNSLWKLHDWKNGYSVNMAKYVPIETYQRVDYCLTSVEEEYEFAREFTGSKFKHLWYTYYSMEVTIGQLMNSTCKGNNIWIGNSAAKENNHLDVLWRLLRSGMLRKFDREEVIIPLSYGTPWVKNLVKRVGRLILGKRLQVLETYIPRDEYNALMLSCSTMIIGYWEPAAQGNVITGLWLGMRVYMSEGNMTYQYFKRLGAHIYSIESDIEKYQFTPLTEEEREENRRVLTTRYSKDHMMKAVVEIAKELNTPKK